MKQTVSFEAPSKLSYAFDLPGKGSAIALFYAVPVGRGRSRVLVRRGRNFGLRNMTKAERISKHLENNVVFDQDMAFLVGQERRLQARLGDGFGGAWKTNYVMPTTADRFVICLRKQLDACAAMMPWRSPPLLPNNDQPLLDRFNQHTKRCTLCLDALKQTRRLLDHAKITRNAALACAIVAATGTALVVPVALLLGAVALAVRSARADVVGPTVSALPNFLGFLSLPLTVGATVVRSLAPYAALALAATAHVAQRRFADLEARGLSTPTNPRPSNMHLRLSILPM